MTRVRTSPRWKSQCFCGHCTEFVCPIAGVYEPNDIIRMHCHACTAIIVFRNEFKHTESDGVPFYGFKQLDHDPQNTRPGTYR